MMQVNVTGGSIGQRELDAYIARANIKYPIGTVQTLDVHVDGEYVDLLSGDEMKAAGVNIPAYGFYYLKKK